MRLPLIPENEGPREPLHGAGEAAEMRSRKKAQEYLGPQPATGRVGGKYLCSVAAAGRAATRLFTHHLPGLARLQQGMGSQNL